MCGGDRVGVPGEVQVERLHRDDLAVAAAGGATLDPEHRTQRGLAKRDRAALAQVAERLAKANSGDRLALPERGRGDGGDDDVLGQRLILERFPSAQVDLRDSSAVGLEQVRSQAHVRGDVRQGSELCCPGDMKVTQHYCSCGAHRGLTGPPAWGVLIKALEHEQCVGAWLARGPHTLRPGLGNLPTSAAVRLPRSKGLRLCRRRSRSVRDTRTPRSDVGTRGRLSVATGPASETCLYPKAQQSAAAMPPSLDCAQEDRHALAPVLH